jgi:hypothetical protein
MNEYYDYINIVYPLLGYIFYKFCKQYYKYILYYNLLVIDMYDNHSQNDYQPMKTTQKEDKSTNTILLVALNQIPT